MIRDFEKGNPSATPQDHAQATLAPKIELEDCRMEWDRSAQELHNLVRGVNPYPGAWSFVHVNNEKKRLKISRTKIVQGIHADPGTIVNIHQTKGNLIVAAKDQALELLEVQLEGKKNVI